MNAATARSVLGPGRAHFEAGRITARCSGRSRVSRPVHADGTGRATRPAAERGR
jgi:hypothetical protein